MINLADTPSILQALQEALQENQQDFINYGQAVPNQPINSQHLYSKMEALHNVTTIAINALQAAQNLNQQKIHFEEGNQALRQDLCQVCMINTELEDRLDEKEKDIISMHKEMKLAHKKIADLEKQLLVAGNIKPDNFDYKRRQLHIICDDDHQNKSMTTVFDEIPIIQSKIEEFNIYDQVIQLRRQIHELKSTILHLNAVIQLQEERQALRRKQQQLKIFELKEKFRENQERQDYIDLIIQQQKKEEQIAQTLTFSHSKHSLAGDIQQLQTSNDLGSDISLRERIRLFRPESTPVLSNTSTLFYYKTKSKNKRPKLNESCISLLRKSKKKSGIQQSKNLWLNNLYCKATQITTVVHKYLRQNIVRKRIKIKNSSLILQQSL